MGTIYYVRCVDCRHFVDVDKFYTLDFFTAERPQDVYAAIRERLEDFQNGSFVERCLKLIAFVNSHNGHRIDFTHEHRWELDYCAKDSPCDAKTPAEQSARVWRDDHGEEWTEVLDEPSTRRPNSIEEVDLRDPTAPSRAVVATAHGEVFVDVRDDGVNAFAPSRPGGRQDYVVLPARTHEAKRKP